MSQPDPSQSPEAEAAITELVAALVAAYGFAVAGGGAARVAQFVTFAAGALASVLNATFVVAEVLAARLLPREPVAGAVIGVPSPASDVPRLEAAFTTIVEDATRPAVATDVPGGPSSEPPGIEGEIAEVALVEPVGDVGAPVDDLEDIPDGDDVDRDDDQFDAVALAEDEEAFQTYRRFVERAEQRQRERIARIVRTEVKDRSRDAFTAALARRGIASVWVASPGACDICGGLDGTRIEPGDEIPESHPGCGCRMRADFEFYDPYVTTGATDGR